MTAPFSVAPEAEAQARSLGMVGDLVAQLWDMYQNSAPFSHPRGNRRFEQYMFTVTGNRVVNIALIDRDPVVENHRQKTRDRMKKRAERGTGFYDLT